jgi:hypothetical protein
MTPSDFHRWLELRGVIITRQYCAALLTEKFCAGPKFKQVFQEITGITLVDGLVEEKEQR